MRITTSEFRWFFLPYCLLRLDDGSYVVTNRRYKPVGMTETEWVHYEQHLVRIKFKRLTKITAQKLDCKGRDSLESIQLYTEDCIPTASDANWKAYSARLQILSKLKVESVA